MLEFARSCLLESYEIKPRGERALLPASCNPTSAANRAVALLLCALLAFACVPAAPGAAQAADTDASERFAAPSEASTPVGESLHNSEAASTESNASNAGDQNTATSDGETNGAQTVRVGWLLNNQDFQSGMPGEYQSGWGYEYLQTLSYYAPAWNYEYVPGTFTELMDKLEAGEIDLMPNISYTPERAEKLLYSTNAQGTEHYYIYAKPSNDALTQGDPAALNGMTIGCNSGVIQTEAGMQWLSDEGVTCNYKFYSTGNELFDALSNDEVDAIIMNDTMSSEDAQPVFSVGESNYFLVTPKSRPDLMSQINAAMTSISAANPRYNYEVKTRYSVGNAGTSALTNTERSWLAARGNTIKFGYLDNVLPYSTESGSELAGALTELINTLENQFEVKIEATAFQSNAELQDALANGAVDVIAPVYKDYWIAEQAGCIQSASFASTALVALYSSNDLDAALGSIAQAPAQLVNKAVLGTRYPQANITEYADAVECIEAVKTGRAGCTIVSVPALNPLREKVDMSDLKTTELAEGAELTCWMRKGDYTLLSIVSKGVINSKDALTAATYSQDTRTEDESAFVEFVSKHQIIIVVSVLMVLIAFILVLVWLLRRARLAQQEAQAANAAKTAFLSRMSHDIRTPLNGIIGLLEIGDLHPDDAKLATQNRKKAKVAADHLLTLINDILEMSKIEDRAVEPENEPFDLEDLIRDIYMLGQLRANERGVDLTIKGARALDFPNVYGSPVHVRRVLLNLVDNCIKYNKPGGSVTCTTANLGVEGDVVTYRFTIADTGIGMTPEFLERIFEPFTQANDDARSNYQGTGMGMPIAKALVEEMGGVITATSTLGEGSTFTVMLPFTIDRNPQTHQSDDENASDISLAGMSIMLVEDNELNTEIARTLLENEGAQVTCAADGQEAVDLFCSKAPGTFDVILMDVMMPKMNGYEATRAIRLSDRLDATTVPIVAMTANAFAEDVQTVKEAGMNDHVSKPIQLDILKEALAKYRHG